MDLLKLLLDFSEVPDDELAQKGREAYKTHYLNREKFGIHQTHDGQEVIFHADRFDHAFYDKPDKWSLVKRRDIPDESRLERLPWIGVLIRGEVPGSECWEVPSPTGRRRPPNRLYVVFEENYVVWLEPRQNGGWKFATAYVKVHGMIRDYCRGGGKIWSRKKNAP